MKRIIAIVFLSIFVVLGLNSQTVYDIGAGQKLVLEEDGSYHIATTEVDVAILIGKQYEFDFERTFDSAISLALLEDPSIAILGKDFLVSIIEETGLIDLIVEEMPDISMIFISRDKVLVSIDGNHIEELSYYVSPDRELIIVQPDNSKEKFGTFNEDYSEIKIAEDGFFVYLKVKNDNK